MSMTHDEMIAVIQAHKEGQKIQVQRNDKGMRLYPPWVDLAGTPCWDFYRRSYRVKPEPPKPREFWLLRDKIYTYSPGFMDPGNWYVGETPIHVREVLPTEERA